MAKLSRMLWTRQYVDHNRNPRESGDPLPISAKSACPLDSRLRGNFEAASAGASEKVFLSTYAKKAKNAGTVALEYGLILPIMIGLMLGVIDISRLLWTVTSLNRAVEVSARWGGINNTTSGVADRAAQEAFGINATAGDFTASLQSCGVQVTANYAFGFLVPWPTANLSLEKRNSIQLTATACHPVVE